jgi:hypothetical protein
MKELLKTYEYKGEKYEIMIVEERGHRYIQDFKNGKPFSPFTHGIVNMPLDLFKRDGFKLVDEAIISAVEEVIRIWADNKDKILKSDVIH